MENSVSGSLVSASLDPFVWGGGVFVVLAGLFYGLGSGRVGGIYRFLTGFVLFGLVGLVFLIIFGLVSVFALVLVSVLVAVLCFVYSFGFFGFSWFGLFKGLLLGGFLIVLFVEFATLVLFNVPAVLNLSPQLSGVALHWNSVELSFSNLAYPFLPYAYLLFILLGVAAFVVRVLPLERLVAKFRSEWFVKFVDRLGSLFELRDGGFGFLRGRFVVLAVIVSAVVSCLFVVFTVLPWVNPTGMLVSADAPVYYQWIVHMRSLDVNSALSFALGDDRALFLVLSYVLSFFVSPLNVVQFVPALLIVLFSVVSLLVLRLVVSIRAVCSVFGVLLVPFSFQSLGLIYSGYFANMLALILVFVYVLLFFKVLDHFSSLGFFVLLGVSGLVFFSHSWTWFIFALTLCMFLFLHGV